MDKLRKAFESKDYTRFDIFYELLITIYPDNEEILNLKILRDEAVVQRTKVVEEKQGKYYKGMIIAFYPDEGEYRRIFCELDYTQLSSGLYNTDYQKKSLLVYIPTQEELPDIKYVANSIEYTQDELMYIIDEWNKRYENMINTQELPEDKLYLLRSLSNINPDALDIKERTFKEEQLLANISNTLHLNRSNMYDVLNPTSDPIPPIPETPVIIYGIEEYTNVDIGELPIGATNYIYYDGYDAVESYTDDCIYQYIKMLSPMQAYKAVGKKTLYGLCEVLDECQDLNVTVYGCDKEIYKKYGTGENQVVVMSNHLYIPKKKFNKLVLPESTSISKTKEYIEVDNIRATIRQAFEKGIVLNYPIDKSKIITKDTVLVKVDKQAKDTFERLFLGDYQYETMTRLSCMSIPIDNLIVYSNPVTDNICKILDTLPLTQNFITNDEYQLMPKESLRKIDIKKCYSRILRNYKLPNNTNWINWEIQPFKKIEPGFIQIKHNIIDLQDFFPSNTYVFYSIVQYLVKIYPTIELINIIKMHCKKIDIDHITGHFTEDDKESKLLLNKFIGWLGRKAKKERMIVTNSRIETSYYGKKRDAQVIDIFSELDKRAFHNEAILNDKTNLKEIRYFQKKLFHSHANYTHSAIIQLGRFQLFKLRNAILPYCAKLLQYRTDSILYVENTPYPINLELYRDEPIHDKIINFNPIQPNQTEPLIIKPWSVSAKDFKLLAGPGGAGKTTLIRENYQDYQYLACTNSAAANLVDAKTIDSLLNLIPGSSYDRIKPCIVGNYVIDECSQMSAYKLACIATLKSLGSNFILSGDFFQGGPVNENACEFSPILRYICDSTKYTLNKVHRFKDPNYSDRIRGFRNELGIQNLNFKFPELPYAEYKRLNICYKRDTVNKINAKLRKLGVEPYYRLPIGKTIKMPNFTITTDFIFELVDGKLHQRFSPRQLVIDFNPLFKKTNAINIHRIQGMNINIEYCLFELDHQHLTNEQRYVAYSRCSDPKLIFQSTNDSL